MSEASSDRISYFGWYRFSYPNVKRNMDTLKIKTILTKEILYESMLILTSRASLTCLLNSNVVCVVRLIYLPEFLT